jgi:hypothetical protein
VALTRAFRVQLALRREARRRALARDDMAAAEGEMMQTVALLVVRGGDTARAAAELLRRPPRRRGASSTGAASARARLAALLAYSQWCVAAAPGCARASKTRPLTLRAQGCACRAAPCAAARQR